MEATATGCFLEFCSIYEREAMNLNRFSRCYLIRKKKALVKMLKGKASCTTKVQSISSFWCRRTQQPLPSK